MELSLSFTLINVWHLVLLTLLIQAQILVRIATGPALHVRDQQLIVLLATLEA